MSKISEWLPRVLFESLLIVVSILLALGLDQWQEDREIQELVDRSIQSFEIEIQRNKSSIEDVYLPPNTTPANRPPQLAPSRYDGKGFFLHCTSLSNTL